MDAPTSLEDPLYRSNVVKTMFFLETAFPSMLLKHQYKAIRCLFDQREQLNAVILRCFLFFSGTK